MLVDEATAAINKLTADLNTRASEDQAAEAVGIIVASCVKSSDVDETEITN
jgi:hypothetical protein